ncbi:hypothetical protein M422DRAFT_54252 [Sphaerobolus stellatus SS14]|uniref:Cyanovirin-N domain-containing protein n=1 Tax=Sphaerobolus stellatus (strain SS14) TaxID=990650 RepID=A0A0C9UVF9_SPHS4|nr:hypothetical protein M422DRAFT_54252 [Sphaerobolus stellatus SS14]
MFVLSSVFVSLLTATSALAAPATSGCSIGLQGNLSPNGNQGNFKMSNGTLTFDPTNLATGFNVGLNLCGAATIVTAGQPWNPSGQLIAANGQCLAAQQSSITTVSCSNAALQSSMTWSFISGFLYWSGPVTQACPSGLYGYLSTDSTSKPVTPIVLACEAAKNGFPFSILF